MVKLEIKYSHDYPMSAPKIIIIESQDIDDE